MEALPLRILTASVGHIFIHREQRIGEAHKARKRQEIVPAVALHDTVDPVELVGLLFVIALPVPVRVVRVVDHVAPFGDVGQDGRPGGQRAVHQIGAADIGDAVDRLDRPVGAEGRRDLILGHKLRAALDVACGDVFRRFPAQHHQIVFLHRNGQGTSRSLKK